MVSMNKPKPFEMEPEREVHAVGTDGLHSYNELSGCPTDSIRAELFGGTNNAFCCTDFDQHLPNSSMGVIRSDDESSGILVAEDSHQDERGDESAFSAHESFDVSASFEDPGAGHAENPKEGSDSNKEASTDNNGDHHGPTGGEESKAPRDEDIVSLFDPSFNWSDDDESGILDSISAIREEASRVDALMAVDQLDTLKQELTSVSRQLNNRSEELHELRTLVQLKEDRLGNLALERDLYKADAEKFQQDLLKLARKLDKIDIEQATSPVLPTVPEQKEADSDDSLTILSEQKVDQNVHQMMLFPQSSVADRRHEFEKATTTVATAKGSETGTADQSGGVEIEHSRQKDGSEAASLVESSSRGSHSKAKNNRVHGGRARRFLRLGRRPVDSNQDTTLSSSCLEMTDMAASESRQQQEMKRRLETAMETSQELRTRIAVVRRYYDDRVRRLQESLVEEKNHRMRVQRDLSRQITELSLRLNNQRD